ncbi:SCP2 sterol-binding domain-containing protein, partial [Blastocladiella britannica]
MNRAVYQFNVKGADNKIHSYTLDLKNTTGDVYQGAYKNGKPEIAITIADADFVALSAGKANGQKLFMSGKLKISGNMMLATKLGTFLMFSLYVCCRCIADHESSTQTLCSRACRRSPSCRFLGGRGPRRGFVDEKYKCNASL